MALASNDRDLGALPLSETVEFYGTADEAEVTLDGIIRRSTDSEACDRQDALWSRGTSFHGIVDLRLPSGLRYTFTVAPAGDESSAHCHYRATRQVYDLGNGSTLALGQSQPLAKLIPFTDSEADSIRLDMPLTRSIPGQFPQAPLSDFTVMFTIHHLSDFLPLVETAFTLGLDPEDVTVIDKEYRYLHSDRVDAHLRFAQNVRVRTYSQLEEAIDEHLTLAEERGKQVLVLDDGGYVLPLVLERFRSRASLIAGVVEQTMSGIRKIQELALPMPLFTVAQSYVKSTVEAYGVADAAVRNTLALLPQEKFEGRSALVLGYGRIGEEVANILRMRRMQVAVYDSDIVRLVAAHERGFATDRDLSELLASWRPILIFGCAGSGSLTGEHFAGLDWDCYLVSTTSRDREFVLSDLSEMSAQIERLGKIGTRYTLANGAAAFVLGHGMPINFHYAESLPNRSIDLVLASVLVGACVLASDKLRFVPGINVKATNDALRDSGLLHKYYDLWQQGKLASEVATS
jgi:S-adenosylhomocysteine hydrolase